MLEEEWACSRTCMVLPQHGTLLTACNSLLSSITEVASLF